MSTELLEKVSSFKIDKSGWKLVKFGDVVREVRETSSDPVAEGIERFIGLEHIETENIHIKTWGQVSNGTTFTRKFKKGQVLFGKRRAYLKKAALATFDGICSGDIVVMEAKEGLLLPELLPFLVNNDKFFDHAVKTSAGSLSPRTKFKDMAELEIFLPPVEQQAKIAELLWVADEMLENISDTINKNKNLLYSAVSEYCLASKNSQEFKLSELIDSLIAGVSVNSIEGQVKIADYAILKTSSVSEGIFLPNEVKKVKPEEVDLVKTSVKANSIIISRMNTVELVGANVYIDKDYPNIFLPDRLWQTVITKKDINVKFLWYILSSPVYRKNISNLCSGTSNSMKNISKSDFLSLKVQIPLINEQEKIVKKIERIENNVKILNNHRTNSKIVFKSILGQIF